jgi:hypothetical protein
VTLAVEGVVVARSDEVVSAPVVDAAVRVVVEPVRLLAAARLAGVRPDVRGQIRVVVGDAAVDHGDLHARAAGRMVPRLGRVGVGVGGPGRPVDGLAAVVQAPEVAVLGVVRRCVQVPDEVGLGVAHVGLALERRDRLGDGQVGVDLDQLEPGQRQLLLERRALVASDVGAFGGVRARAEADQDLAGDEVGLEPEQLRRRERRLRVRR